jgi:hypothetical protein
VFHIGSTICTALLGDDGGFSDFTNVWQGSIHTTFNMRHDGGSAQ